jgi:hypothetical protein
MRTASLITSLGIALLVGCSEAPDKPQIARLSAAPAQPAVKESVEEATQVIAYYFHGTVRCETCLKIEKQAQELISNRFASQVTFKSVNYDQSENAHFLTDYKLRCPSLVLVRQKNRKDQNWKLLGQTWDHAQIPPKLDRYIEEENSKFLEDGK